MAPRNSLSTTPPPTGPSRLPPRRRVTHTRPVCAGAGWEENPPGPRGGRSPRPRAEGGQEGRAERPRLTSGRDKSQQLCPPLEPLSVRPSRCPAVTAPRRRPAEHLQLEERGAKAWEHPRGRSREDQQAEQAPGTEASGRLWPGVGGRPVSPCVRSLPAPRPSTGSGGSTAPPRGFGAAMGAGGTPGPEKGQRERAPEEITCCHAHRQPRAGLGVALPPRGRGEARSPAGESQRRAGEGGGRGHEQGRRKPGGENPK